MRASVGHRAPIGERNEAGRPHLQQRRVSVLERPTGCITYDHRQKGTHNLNRRRLPYYGVRGGTITSLPTKSFLVNRSWASRIPLRG